MLRLITIPISHYCEKARWALERADIPYREERHVQLIHRIAARRAGGGQTVPVLVTPEGTLGARSPSGGCSPTSLRNAPRSSGSAAASTSGSARAAAASCT